MFRPYPGVGPGGASDLERLALGKFALKPSSASGFEDSRTGAGRRSSAYLVGRRPQKPGEPFPCLCAGGREPWPRRGSAAARALEPRGGASRTPGSGGGDRPARRRRETVAWKLGRRRSLEQTAAEGRAQQRRAGGGAAWTRSAAVAPEVGSRPSAGGRRGGCGRGPASRTPRGCRPPEGAAGRSGPTRTGAGSGPSQHLAVLALHPKLTPTPEPCHGHQTTHQHTTPHSLRAHSSLTPACACACDWGHSLPAWHLHMR